MSFRVFCRQFPMIIIATAFVFLVEASPLVGRVVFAAAGGEFLSEARRPDAQTSTMTLENDLLGAKFDSHTGSLIQLMNKLTNETIDVEGDEFQIEATEFTLAQRDATLSSLVKQSDQQLHAIYQAEGRKIIAKWRLGKNRHFLEKQLVIRSSSPFDFRKLAISKPAFAGIPVELVRYCHMRTVTYFGRSPEGGIFLGVELAFDHSSLDGQNRVALGYAPGFKVKSGQQIVCEPVYLGVYRRQKDEQENEGLPLASESEAMVAMTSAILPPSHQRLGPLMCGWWSETFRGPYQTQSEAQHDMRSIDFCRECGIDIISDGRVWAGEVRKVNALKGDKKFQLSDLALEVARYAREKGVRWMFWPTMGNTDPWGHGGQQFRLDKPEWKMIHEGEELVRAKPAACFACEPFYDWLAELQLDAMDAGQYGAWVVDGDFFGGAGSGGGRKFAPGSHVFPARCHSKLHDHVTPDVDYVCQHNLMELAGLMRRRYPDAYLFYCRPPMDLGVWALRHVDASFTVNEWAQLKGLPGMDAQPVNVLLGDKIRHWSRVRVHHHFFPHYLDSPQVFAAPKSMTGLGWQSNKIDYIMLSALSSSPNQTYYMPSQAGIPAEDKQRIKKWLNWGRKNIDYIMVRKDLPVWPAKGKVDGSAHICGDRGLVFLFNPNKESLHGEFTLTGESIGLKAKGPFQVNQEYPESDRTQQLADGRTVRWEVPGETALVLKIQPADEQP